VSDSRNAAVARRIVDAFNRRDLSLAAADLHPDVELDEWQEAPGARTYRGAEGVQAALDSWFETWEWMRVEIQELREVGDRVLFTLHQRAKGRGSGIEIEITSWNVYSFRDGKVTRMQLFTSREPAFEAAGLATNYQEERR
jgi:ketosteroid isomerase-like protein